MLFVGASAKLLVGVSVVLVAPVALTMVRPVTKQIIKGGVHIADKLKRCAAGPGEQTYTVVDGASTEVLDSQTATDTAPVEITANVTVNLDAANLPTAEQSPR